METKTTWVAFNPGVERISRMLKSLIIAQMVLLAFSAQSWGAKAKIISVDCGKGQTISDALRNSEGTATKIVVSGICNENVVIAQNDITLVANPPLSGSVSAFDSSYDAIRVTGVRTSIDGLMVMGGKNGIFFEGGTGTVDKCTIQQSALHGIAIRGSSVEVTNSVISGNNGCGITIGVGASGRIGFKSSPAQYAGNTIRQNGGSGIFVSIGSGAQIAGNEITGNGITTDPNKPFERVGIWAASASGVFLPGGNIITNNVSSGVLAQQSSINFGDGTMVGLPPGQYNIVHGNSTAADDCEVRGIMGSSLEVGYVNISPPSLSSTTGLCVSRNSIARLYGSVTKISNNRLGASLKLGGSLIAQSFSANDYFIFGNRDGAISCSGTESHIEPYPMRSVSGSVSGACTPF